MSKQKPEYESWELPILREYCLKIAEKQTKDYEGGRSANGSNFLWKEDARDRFKKNQYRQACEKLGIKP